MPAGLEGVRFYSPGEAEATLGRRARARARRAGAHAVSAPLEDMAAVTRLWAQLRVPDRARYMERIAQAVIDEFEDLCLALAGESQRPRARDRGARAARRRRRPATGSERTPSSCSAPTASRSPARCTR